MESSDSSHRSQSSRSEEVVSSFLDRREYFYGGLGLRPTHYSYLESHRPQLTNFFEIISENYFETEGRPLTKLLELRKSFPIACHGVSLGIGSPDELNPLYLKKLKRLINLVEPMIVSDHFCWTSQGGHYSHDLLPLPYTNETLQRVIRKVEQTQDFLGREILLENPSAYIMFPQNEMNEVDFLKAVTQKTGCGLLLDINNIYVSCTNFGWDPNHYLQQIPKKSVGQIHLAGFTDMGKFLFDTHSAQVHGNVWKLYRNFVRGLKTTPVMIEWDDHIPEFPIYEQELKKANDIWYEAHEERTATSSAIL